MHYKIELDLFSDHDDNENPTFYFDNYQEFEMFMKICFRNGYRLIVDELTEEQYNKELDEL